MTREEYEAFKASHEALESALESKLVAMGKLANAIHEQNELRKTLISIYKRRLSIAIKALKREHEEGYCPHEHCLEALKEMVKE